MKENDIQPINSPLSNMFFYYIPIHSHTSKPRAKERNNIRVAKTCQAMQGTLYTLTVLHYFFLTVL